MSNASSSPRIASSTSLRSIPQPFVSILNIAVNAAVVGFYLRERRDEFNVIKHLVVPVLGVVAMIPALLSVIGGLTIPIFDVELAAWEGALAWTAPIVAAWMVIGIVLYLVLRASNSGALARLGEIYGGETPPPER